MQRFRPIDPVPLVLATRTGQPALQNDTVYAATMEWCGIAEPTGSSTGPGGWDITSLHHASRPCTTSTRLCRPAALAPSLQVDTHDYRNVAGSFVPAAYSEPAWIRM